MNRITLSDKYDYINEESISERLKCTICTNPFIDPVKTKCKPKEHIFCQYCIKDWLRNNSSCPTCRQNLKIQDLISITEGVLLDMLNELSIQCSICKTKGLERGNYDEHLNKYCNKQTIACTSVDIKCPWNGTQKKLDEHLKTCPYTALRPMLIEMLNDKKQLQQQITQQQILIHQLEQEHQQCKQHTESQRVPPQLPNGKSSQQSQQRTRQNSAKPSMFKNDQTSSTKVACGNCSDCWRGAVRGSYFRGEKGGGLKLGSTLVSCDCNCHK